MIPISLVVARARDGTIGDKGGMPWHIGADLRRFKALTMGKPVIMGRKTWESLPKKPLPGRTNIVVTRDRAFAAPGVRVVHDVEDALTLGVSEHATEIMVIGGAEIFAAVLPRATRVHLTEIDADFAGDTTMPAFDPRDWRESARERHTSEDGLAYSYVTLERR